jgi:hypothetical protein
MSNLTGTWLLRFIVSVLLVMLSDSASSQPSGTITVTQVSSGRVSLHLSCSCANRDPYDFLVTVSDHAIQTVTVFGDTGLPVNPRTVTVGPLPDGPYTVTWIETSGQTGVSVGEQYSGSFTLVRGILLDSAAAVPSNGPEILVMLLLFIGITASRSLKQARPRT